jgi:hypothetical protein
MTNICACGKPAEHVNAPEESADWACRVPDPAAHMSQSGTPGRLPSAIFAEAVTHRIEGWSAPKWATHHSLDEGSIAWMRGTGVTVGEDEVEPMLTRDDDIEIQPETGSLAVVVGPLRIHIGDDSYISVADARILAPLLLELADAAEAGR